MPIKARIDMLTTGVRTPVGIKVFGADLKEIEAHRHAPRGDPAAACPARAASSPSAPPAATSSTSTSNREALARYGLSVGAVQDVIMSAIGGENVTTTIEGRARFPVNVRYPRDLRDDLDRLGQVLVMTPSGAQIPLRAGGRHPDASPGPSMIRNENGLLAGYVYVDMTDRDVGGYVERARGGRRRAA